MYAYTQTVYEAGSRTAVFDVAGRHRIFYSAADGGSLGRTANRTAVLPLVLRMVLRMLLCRNTVASNSKLCTLANAGVWQRK